MQPSNKEAVNEVLEAIREVCDLKRLEFGCEVRLLHKNHWSEKMYEYFRTSYFQLDTDKWRFVGGTGWFDFGEYKLREHCFEIIGLPVHLEHLLWALEQTVGRPWSTFSSVMGIFIGFANGINFPYNLQKSVEQNLNDNPDLTKWLHELLVTN